MELSQIMRDGSEVNKPKFTYNTIFLMIRFSFFFVFSNTREGELQHRSPIAFQLKLQDLDSDLFRRLSPLKYLPRCDDTLQKLSHKQATQEFICV